MHLLALESSEPSHAATIARFVINIRFSRTRIERITHRRVVLRPLRRRPSSQHAADARLGSRVEALLPAARDKVFLLLGAFRVGHFAKRPAGVALVELKDCVHPRIRIVRRAEPVARPVLP